MTWRRQIALLLLWTLCCALVAFGYTAAIWLMAVFATVIPSGLRGVWSEFTRPFPLKELYWGIAIWCFAILAIVAMVRLTPAAWFDYVSTHKKFFVGIVWFPVAMLYVRNLIRLRRAYGTQPEGGADPA